MSLSIRSVSSAHEIEEKGYLSPDELDRLPNDLNTKKVRLLKSNNLKTTSLSKNLPSLNFIHYVDLSGTQIKGDELKALPPRIIKLNIEDCEEIEFLPSSLKELEFLTSLNVSKTYLKNDSLENLPVSLEILNIDSCKRISELPKSLLDLKNLKSISLSSTKVISFQNLPREVEKIDARFCPIETIDSSFYVRANLRTLNLKNKRFDVDSLRYIAANIYPSCIELQLITIDSESAKLFYNRFNKSFFSRAYTDQRCINLIRSRLKTQKVRIIIENWSS